MPPAVDNKPEIIVATKTDLDTDGILLDDLKQRLRKLVNEEGQVTRRPGAGIG